MKRILQKISASTVAASLIMLIGSSPVLAVPLALDSFELPGVTVGSIDGQGNAGDWVGPWSGVSGQTIIDVSGNPLTKTLPDGTTINGGDQAISVTGTANNLAAREFGTPINDQVYLGFLLRFEAGSIDNNDFVTICFNDDALCDFATIPTVGLKADIGPGSTDIMVRAAASNGEYSNQQVNIGETNYIVARVYKTGGPTDPFDRVDLWVNPDLSIPNIENLPEATSTEISSVSAVTHIAMRSATLSGSDEVIVDGFQLATEWDDVFEPPPETLRINEVEYDAVQSGDDTAHEWIELYNYGPDPVNASGWSVENAAGTSAVLPVGSIIGSGEYYLLANNATNVTTNYPGITPDVDLSPSVGLANGPDSVTLKQTAGTIVDFVAWEGETVGWNEEASADSGDTICRVDATVDTDMPGDWQMCVTATPRAINNTNNPPSDILIDGMSADSIAENASMSTLVGSLTSTDPDSGDSHTYSLIAGVGDEDNMRFTIGGTNNDELLLAFTPDYELPVDLGDTTGNNTYTVRVRTDDGQGGVYEKVLTITVTDVDDTSPSTPVAPDLLTSSDTRELDTDDITADTTPSFSVVCGESGSTITLRANGSPVGSILCLVPGVFTVSAGSLLDGPYAINYTETDAAMNESTASPTLNIIIDTTPVDDGDGVIESVENAGPNGGDANGDGLLDGVQNSVASIVNQTNSKYLALGASGIDCSQLSGFSVLAESDLSAQSSMYEFPLGIFDFSVVCTTLGGSTTVTFYLDSVYNTSEWVFVKYDRSSQQYEDFSSLVSYSTQLVGSDLVTTISYEITDGAYLDEDALANGVILDPAGPAIETVSTSTQVPTLQNTGSSPLIFITVALSIFSAMAWIDVSMGLVQRRRD